MLSLHTWEYNEELWERNCKRCSLTQEHVVLGYSDYDSGSTWVKKARSNDADKLNQKQEYVANLKMLKTH